MANEKISFIEDRKHFDMLMKAKNNKLILSGNHTLNDIQIAFNQAYPFLKIDFYKKLNGNERWKIPGTSLLRHAGLKKKGYLLINDKTTVIQLEQQLYQKFGLYAEISRKSGTTWLETTMTDKWTLKQQNDHGQELSQTYKPVGGIDDL